MRRLLALSADNLLDWREWQIAAPPPPRRDYVVAPRPYYYRNPAPYHGAPYPYFGPSVRAGGFGHHFGGRICF